MVAENLIQVQKNIEEACKKVNRDPDEVTLIAVSKTKPVEMLKEAYEAGARVFGENKVQEIVDKYDQMPSDVKWHMIGHLQRNKVKYIVDKVAMIHSVDSLRLAETIEKEAEKKKQKQRQEQQESNDRIEEIILQMAELAPVTVRDLLSVLEITQEEAEKQLSFLCQQGYLIKTEEAGNIRYQKAG